MIETITVTAALAVLLGAAWFLLGRSRQHRPAVEPYRVWALARANTSDGVTAHLEVEVLVQLTDPGLDRSALDADVVDAIEDELRQRITAHPVASLPSVGDDTPFLTADLLPGCEVLRGAVTISDVEVTPELRRLVTDRSAP